VNALLYLQLASLQGLIRARLLRLKQPKYLMGAVVGTAYIYFFLVRRAAAGYGHVSYGHSAPFPTDVSPAFTALWSLALLMIILFNWILPRATASLGFSEAEIAFLFPAPISRRSLVHYRLLSSQLAIGFSSLVLALFFNRWTFLPGSAVSHALGWWIILGTLSLHGTASSFVITRLVNRGVPAWRPRLMVLGLVSLMVAAVVVWVLDHAREPGPADLLSFQTITAYLSPLLTSGPLPWVLALPKLVLAPCLATDWGTFALALAPALLVLGAHYVFALFSVASFEEASIARAEKRAARAKARQLGTSRVTALKARRARFKLAQTGRPETAFLWKNLLATPSLFRPRTALIAAALIAAACVWLAQHPLYHAILPGVAVFSLIIAAYVLILGPQLARYDLRADLVNADMLKTYPLRGWQIILGELLTPIAILTVIVWLMLLAAALSLPFREAAWLSVQARAAIAAAIALLVPLFCALQLLMPNAAAVIFPAWAQAVSNRSERGLDVLGQRLIFLGGQLLILVIALLPLALGGALAFFVANWMAGQIAAVVVAYLAALMTLVLEVWVGIRWLGYCFERFDLSS
jgi:hypothetical protein